MFIIHFLINLAIVGIELSLVAGAGWLAWKQPLVFSAISAGLTLLLGLRLEGRRLSFEMPFYFERSSALGRFVRMLLGAGQAILKSVVAGLVALMTFGGTASERLQVMAILFAVCVYAGSTLLRRLTISFGAKPASWGFFRMTAPLGLLFSAGMSFFPPPSSLDVAKRVLLDLPARPGIAQASEALFSLRLWIDDLLVRLMGGVIGPDWARIVGIVIGSNVLAGLVLSVFAVTISEVVRVLEEGHWRMRGLVPKGR